MGDALSKPAEPWEDELPASPPAQQVPPADAAAEQPPTADRRRVKVSSARLKPADAGGGLAADPVPAAAADTPAGGQQEANPAPAAVTARHEAAAHEPVAGPAAAAGRKRKAAEPADGDGPDAKRQQLLGLTILTLGVLQGLVPFAPRQPVQAPGAAAPAAEQQPQQQPPAPEMGEADGVRAEGETKDTPADGAEVTAGLAASAPTAAPPPLSPVAAAPQQQDAEAVEQLPEAAVQDTPPQEVPLSAAKPVSRLQLRQQLQLRSQRAGGAHSPAVRAAGRVVGTPAAPTAAAGTAAGGRSTRGQRLLGLVRQQQHAEPAAAQQASDAEVPQREAQLFAAGQMAAEGMDVDVPAGNAAVEQQVPVGARQLAQRRLTQSPCRMAAPLAEGGSEADGHEAQATPDVPAKAAGGECTPSRPPPAALSTPTIAEPGSALHPAHAAARAATAGASPGQPNGSPLQAASAQEGDVEAALQQVGRLLVDLRGDSPQPSWQRHGARAPEPAGPPEPEQARAEATLQLDSEVQSRRQTSPAPADQQQAGVAQPPSPQEVSSKQRLQEEGADNFPGFWRPPAAGSPTAAGDSAGPRRRSSRKRAAPVQFVADKQQQRRAGQAQQQGGSAEATPMRGRRVRFCVPEEQEAQPAAAPAPQHPTPLVVAPPVLPSGRAGSSAGRPATPAKPAPLRMPQPPAFSRFGAAAFHRPYAGPQGRRQALMSFVSEGGASCFALPPVPPADGEGGEGPLAPDAAASPGGPAAGEDSGLVIPRRLQHRQGLGRRLSLQPDQPSLQGHELLAQEVREAFLNARLADHAGEPWARLDVAGCELWPGNAHAEALAELSSKMEALRGTEAVSQLLSQLDAEWLHLKRLRQKYVGAPAAAAASPSPPHSQGVAVSPAAAASVGGTDEAARPRGILKHKSSLSGEGQAAAAAAAAAAVREVAAQEQAAQSAAAGSAAPMDPAAAGFEAILAADIVSEGAPAEVAPPAAQAPPAAPATEEPGAAGTQQQEQQLVPDAMEIDGAASPAVQAPEAPEPAAAVPAACPVPAAAAEAAQAPALAVAAPAPAPADGGAAQDAAAGEEAGQEQEPLSPRPVELTPGPSLSRGQKMLARLGTPVAAGKLQLLAGLDVGRKVAGASPLFAGRPGGGGAAPPQRRAGGRMSRGERLLAVAKGSTITVPAAASPAPVGPAGEGAAEEGPTLARAAAVLL